jgi:predicted dienelactone hydrolase
MTRKQWFVLSLIAGIAAGPGASRPAHAADCDGPFSAGYRVLAMDNGRKVAVWYPTRTAEPPATKRRAGAGFASRVARDAPPAACPRVPLILFSHGWGGCGTQLIFFTEELARHGYVVAAPDHADAACTVGSDDMRLDRLRLDASFLEPARWDERSHLGRLQDLRAAIGRVAADAALAGIADASRIGAAGHSLGGYAALGMAGGWPSWKTAEVRAVLAFSPYAAPFVIHGALARLHVPVMYQGGTLDWGLTAALEGPRGAYAQSAPPKFFVKLDGATHLDWTNLACAGTRDVPSCLQERPNVAMIDRYGIAFFDRYLKGRAGELLDSPGRGLSAYRFEVTSRPAAGAAARSVEAPSTERAAGF